MQLDGKELKMTSDLLDKPFGDLPEGETLNFKDSKIEAVIVEIRYPEIKSSNLADSAGKLLKVFSKYGVSQIESAEQHNISVNLGKDRKSDSQIQIADKGWQISDPEKSVVFTLMSSMASLQFRTYDRWSVSVLPQLESLLSITKEVLSPELSTRIGLRYVNRLIGNVGEPADQWKGRVESSFLGPIEHPLLGKLVREAHQILRFEIEPGVFAVLRHGPLADVESGLGSYIVDIDVSVERAVDFDPAVVLQLAQRLNRTAFSIFKLVLSKEELHQMKTVAFRATEMDQSK